MFDDHEADQPPWPDVIAGQFFSEDTNKQLNASQGISNFVGHFGGHLAHRCEPVVSGCLILEPLDLRYILQHHNVSNLFTALETGPTELLLDVEGWINPLGTEYNFVTDSSEYQVLLELFLPLHGYAENLTVKDTLDFIFSDFYSQPAEEIEKLILRFNFINGFPLNIKVQAYFYDGNDVLLDSLFRDPEDPARFIPAATDNNGDGRVEPLTLDPVEVEFTRQQIDNISSSVYMVVYYTLTTPGADQVPPEKVRFYMDYFFEAYIGAIGILDVNSANY